MGPSRQGRSNPADAECAASYRRASKQTRRGACLLPAGRAPLRAVAAARSTRSAHRSRPQRAAARGARSLPARRCRPSKPGRLWRPSQDPRIESGPPFSFPPLKPPFPDFPLRGSSSRGDNRKGDPDGYIQDSRYAAAKRGSFGGRDANSPSMRSPRRIGSPPLNHRAPRAGAVEHGAAFARSPRARPLRRVPHAAHSPCRPGLRLEGGASGGNVATLPHAGAAPHFRRNALGPSA